MDYVIKYQDKLVKKYNYRKLDYSLSEEARKYYFDNLPCWIKINGDRIELCTIKGTIFSKGYERVVIGDYGAFIEISKNDIITDNMILKEGEEYRLSDKYNVKYLWYTINDYSDIKIYFQQRSVVYADYKPDMYYVCPYQVILKNSNDFDFLNI